jgi:succinate dehydrogenase hydrophobic anchor subunit
MSKILRNNGLSIVLTLLFLLFLVGQADFAGYLNTSHFVEATTENWESEFLQMFFFVVLTACLFQKGSAESKDPDKEEPVDRDPRKTRKKKNAPWPVRKGGWALTVYEYSLSLAFLLLFLMSFTLHAVSGAREYNESEREHGRYEQVTTLQYMGTPRFWFESLQNWQSEFLAVGAMVVFSIFLRQRGSPESKPVDTPHSETGE